MMNVSYDTKQENKEAFFPETKGMVAADIAVEFIFDEIIHNDNPTVDIGTLRKFLIFLKSKNYN